MVVRILRKVTLAAVAAAEPGEATYQATGEQTVSRVSAGEPHIGERGPIGVVPVTGAQGSPSGNREADTWPLATEPSKGLSTVEGPFFHSRTQCAGGPLRWGLHGQRRPCAPTEVCTQRRGNWMSTSRRGQWARRTVVALASASVIGMGLTAPAAYASPNSHAADHGNLKLTTTLTGAMEVPGPGDSDGRATARIMIKKNQICFTLVYQGIDTPLAAHIHEAPEGVAGPVVVPLPLTKLNETQAAIQRVRGCVEVDAALLADIRHNPNAYYVNMHNADFPAGALRGQLPS